MPDHAPEATARELDPRMAVELLTREGLLAPADLVGDGVAVLDVSRRHRVLHVSRPGAAGFVVKQGSDAAGVALARERAMYERLAGADAAAVRRYVPRVRALDARSRTLTLDAPPSARSLREHQARVGRLSSGVAADVGRALARLHRLDRDAAPRLAGLPPPWPLLTHRPTVRTYAEMSPAHEELALLVQQTDGFGVLLDALRAEWRAIGIIHGDCKWGNVVVGGSPGSRRQVLLVDWETAGIGDPAWDVGSFFGECLTAWASSMPVIGGVEPAVLPRLARRPLRSLQPAMLAYWNAYAREARLDAAGRELLLRATRFGAARMLQTVWERAREAQRLDGALLMLTQVSVNVLRRPADAAARLLGVAEAT